MKYKVLFSLLSVMKDWYVCIHGSDIEISADTSIYFQILYLSHHVILVIKEVGCDKWDM
jgi:hypothetical protein